MRACLIRFVPLLLLNAALFGCEPQNTYNTQNQQQNTAASASKAAALQPAVGHYCGSMHLVQSNLDFAVRLNLQIVEDNVRSSQSTDPADTVQIPKLAGSMTFPAITNQGSAAYSTVPELMQATGGYGAVSFTFGDYNPLNQTINLPFNIPGGTQGNYGVVNGTLNGNTFDGNWFSESSQLVGTFSLNKCEGSSS